MNRTHVRSLVESPASATLYLIGAEQKEEG